MNGTLYFIGNTGKASNGGESQTIGFAANQLNEGNCLRLYTFLKSFLPKDNLGWAAITFNDSHIEIELTLGQSKTLTKGDLFKKHCDKFLKKITDELANLLITFNKEDAIVYTKEKYVELLANTENESKKNQLNIANYCRKIKAGIEAYKSLEGRHLYRVNSDAKPGKARAGTYLDKIDSKPDDDLLLLTIAALLSDSNNGHTLKNCVVEQLNSKEDIKYPTETSALYFSIFSAGLEKNRVHTQKNIDAISRQIAERANSATTDPVTLDDCYSVTSDSFEIKTDSYCSLM